MGLRRVIWRRCVDLFSFFLSTINIRNVFRFHGLVRNGAWLLVYWSCVRLSLVLASCLSRVWYRSCRRIHHSSFMTQTSPSHRRNRKARKLRRRATSSHGNMSPTSTTWSPIRNFKSQMLSRLPISIPLWIDGRWRVDGFVIYQH